jgi:hypothetical protein
MVSLRVIIHPSLLIPTILLHNNRLANGRNLEGLIVAAVMGAKNEAVIPGRVQKQQSWLGDQIPPEPADPIWTSLC